MVIEKWSSYQERLEEYFAVNDIANDKKVSALLTLLGGKTYSLLRIHFNTTEASYQRDIKYHQQTLVDKG